MDKTLSLLGLGIAGYFLLRANQAQAGYKWASLGDGYKWDDMQNEPRGIRNNNPGNIEYHPVNEWQGQTGHDGRYAIFSEAVYGIRAIARILQNYRARGVISLEQIISTWAPDTENNTGAYILHVSEKTQIAPGAPVESWQYPALIEAIIYHENGKQPYPLWIINQGIALA